MVNCYAFIVWSSHGIWLKSMPKEFLGSGKLNYEENIEQKEGFVAIKDFIYDVDAYIALREMTTLDHKMLGIWPQGKST